MLIKYIAVFGAQYEKFAKTDITVYSVYFNFIIFLFDWLLNNPVDFLFLSNDKTKQTVDKGLPFILTLIVLYYNCLYRPVSTKKQYNLYIISQ